MIEFADKSLAIRFVAVHKKLKELAREFDSWSRKNKMPSPVITGLDRTPEWYDQRELDRPVFSWHYALPVSFGDYSSFVICALDFRNKHYRPDQRKQAGEWLVKRCPVGEWEVILVDHGTGPHFHVAYKDFGLRRNYELLQEKNDGPQKHSA